MAFNFWDFRIKSDDYLFWVVNMLLKLKSMRASGVLRQNVELKGVHEGEEAWIIMNGPSINKQDLTRLKGKVLFFVNRAFKHKDYAYLQPKYHLFIDPKMATGEWPLSYLDEILEVNPEVTFLLNYRWAKLQKFKEYEEKAKIYWINTELYFNPSYKRKIDLTRAVPGGAVFGACLVSAMYMGFQPIYFTGFDGNGLAYELIKKDSHFYGTNEENNLKTTRDYVKDLYMMSRSLRTLWTTSEYCQRHGVEVYNLTEGGLIDMFQRKSFKELLNSDSTGS